MGSRKCASNRIARGQWLTLLCLSAAWLGACAKPAAPLADRAPPPCVAPLAIAPVDVEPDMPLASSAPPGVPAATPADSALADRPTAPAPAAQFERLVLFAPRGPLIVHLEILVDGRPQRQLADEALDEATQALGAKGSVEASWTELVANPRFVAGELGNAPINNPAAGRQIIQQFDANRDGRVQRKELAAFLAQDNTEGRAFSVQSAGDARTESKQDSPLLAILDQDQDGRLSAAEMAAAPQRLRSRDADDDDVLVAADFRSPVVAAPAMERGQKYGRRQALELNRLEIDSIFYTLAELYSSQAGLDAASFALTPGLLAALDADSSGSVDQKEIAALVDARADLSFKVTFGAGSQPDSQPAIELLAMSDDLVAAGGEARAIAGGFDVVLPGFDIEVSVADFVPPGTAKTRPYGALQVQARVGQAEDPLFSWLDQNQDGRLTAREMSAAPERLAALDHDGDGFVSVAEIPDRMTCSILCGLAPSDATATRAARGGPTVGPGPPAWLTAMDTNRDGEISRREFLGTAEQFAQMDANGDGFLDAGELSGPAESAP